MGIKFEGLPPESNDKLNRIISDNIVTGNEVQGLNAAEQEALSSLLGGKLPDVGDEVKVPKRHVGEAEDKPKKSGGNGLGIAACIVAGTTALGAIVGGVAGFFAGGAGAVPGAAAGAKLGAGLGALLATATSCGKEGPNINYNYTGNFYNIPITIMTSDEATKELINLVNKLLEQNADLKAAIEELKKSQDENSQRMLESLQQLVARFDELGEGIAYIAKILLEQGISLKEIIALLEATNKTQEDILNGLSNGNEKILEALTKIFDAVNSGTELSAKNNILLEQLVQLVSSLDSNTDESLKNTIEQMFAMLAEAIQKGQEIDEKTYDLLLSMSNDIKEGNTQNAEFYETIINKFDGLEGVMKDYLKNILEAVNKNSAISEDIKNLTMKVLEQINNGAVANNDALKAILEAISKIQVGDGGNVDLSTIEKMLAELLDQSKSNGELLSSIDGKLDVINMTIKTAKEEILNKLGEGFDKTDQHYKNIEATLNDIVNNAGAGFDDSEILTHLDLILKSIEKISEKFPDKTDLLAKLDEILAAIKDHKVIVNVEGEITCKCDCDNSGSHEGIVGDLEDLLG